MIIEQEKKLDITSSVVGEEIAMTIDADATQHLLGVLTNLYSDQMLAVIREIGCNAWDAHVAAGNKDPIKVTLPSSLNPMFIVQDWGTGLDAEDFRNVYSRYGKSTKRDTNEQTGSFGLGCKAPLTYTDQFTVTGVKNGIQTNAIIGRNEKNMPTLTIMSETPTDEPNGVTVMVNIKTIDMNTFNGKAQEFFRWWDAGTVLVNGNTPEYPEIMYTIDNVQVVKENMFSTEPILLMGNVAYPIREHFEAARDINRVNTVVIKAPLGSVHLTPNREDLQFTNKTVAYVKLAEDILIANYKDRGIAQIKSKKKYEYLKAIQQWNSQFGYNSTLFRLVGEEFGVPTTIYFDENQDGEHINGVIHAASEGNSKYEIVTYSLRYLHIGNNEPIIENFNGKLTPYLKKKIRYYLAQKNISTYKFILVKDKISAGQREWLNPDNFYDFQDIKDIKLPKSPPGFKSSTTYRTYEVDTQPRFFTISELNNADYDLICYSTAKCSAFFFSIMGYKNVAVINIGSNQVDKIKREVKNVREYNELVEEISLKWWKGLTKNKRIALQHINSNNWLSLPLKDNFEISKLLDPKLREVCNIQRDSLTDDEKTRYVQVRDFIPEDQIEQIEEYEITKRYPLLDWYPGNKSSKEHNTIYVNAVWEELYKNE